MSIHITVVPASTKVGRETIRTLLKSESKTRIRAIYRDPSKAPTDLIEHPQFEAVKGDVGTGAGLDFTGSDAVFYIPPPTFDGTDQGEWASKAATNVKTALQQAPGVKRVILLSAVGAYHEHGTGMLRLNYVSDEILKDAAPHVTIVRPGYFQEDWEAFLKEGQADPPVVRSWITPIDHKIPAVSVKDIAEFCASALLSESAKPSPRVVKVFGPRNYSSRDIKDAVEKATGKTVELQLVERDQLGEYMAQIIPEPYVQAFVDMTTAGLPGGVIVPDFEYDEDTVRGRVELVDTFRELHAKSQQA